MWFIEFRILGTTIWKTKNFRSKRDAELFMLTFDNRFEWFEPQYIKEEQIMEIIEMKKVNELSKKVSKLLDGNGTIIAKSENRLEISLAFKREGLDSWKFFEKIMSELGAKDYSSVIPHSYRYDGITIVAFVGNVKN